VNFIITHGVRAQRALADGDVEVAERWARNAVDYASLTDDLVHNANTNSTSLASFYPHSSVTVTALERNRTRAPGSRDSGSTRSARPVLTKGDRPGAHQTRALLHELGADQ
jgi:hypothetical protein